MCAKQSEAGGWGWVLEAAGGEGRMAVGKGPHLCWLLCVQDCHHHNHWQHWQRQWQRLRQMALCLGIAPPTCRRPSPRERQSRPTFSRATRNFHHKYSVYYKNALAEGISEGSRIVRLPGPLAYILKRKLKDMESKIFHPKQQALNIIF